LLSQNDVERIHETAIRILEEVGIEVPLSEAVEIYKKGGIRRQRKKIQMQGAQILRNEAYMEPHSQACGTACYAHTGATS